MEHLINLQQNIEMDIFDMNFIDIDYHIMEKLRQTIGLEVQCTDPNILMDVDMDCNDKKRMLIIIDDNMYYRSMRYEYYQIAKKCEFNFYFSSFKSIFFTHRKNQWRFTSSSRRYYKLLKFTPK